MERDDAWLEHLYERHHRAVAAYCMRRVARADAADAVAQVFATTWRRRADVPEGLPTPPSREQVAVTTAEAYLTALYAGDADRAVALTNPDVSNLRADRNIALMFGAADPSDRPAVGSCTATDEQVWVLVRCEVAQHDPVFTELGLERLIAPIRVYDDGTIAWLPWEGGDFTDANRALSDYLRLHHPVEYEGVCSPGAYEPGSIAANGDLALTGACAELWTPLSQDIARWIRDGRPGPDG